MEAGLNVRVEPTTYDLLLGEFSKEDCRRIFPKAASRLYQDRFRAVLNALETVSSPACTISAAEKAAYVQVRIDALLCSSLKRILTGLGSLFTAL